MIVGLDHVAREQVVECPLMSDLPSPEAIPVGVYVVLGTQTTELAALPVAVRQAVEQPGRRVEMGRLSREAVEAVVRASWLAKEPIPRQLERIFALSGGHPLALRYLVNALQAASDAAGVDAIFDATEAAALLGIVVVPPTCPRRNFAAVAKSCDRSPRTSDKGNVGGSHVSSCNCSA